MITGAHAMIYSTDSEADRAFLRDVLGLGHVDVGGGWLIFGLPPSEIAVHPGQKSAHEIYFMCEDVNAFKSYLDAQEITTSPVQDQGWGLVTTVTLPGGGALGVYEPRHARPESAGAAAGKRASKPPSAKQAVPKQAVKAAAKKTAPAAVKKAPAQKAPAKKAPAKSAAAKATAAKAAKKAPVPAKKPATLGKGKKASRRGR